MQQLSLIERNELVLVAVDDQERRRVLRDMGDGTGQFRLFLVLRRCAAQQLEHRVIGAGVVADDLDEVGWATEIAHGTQKSNRH